MSRAFDDLYMLDRACEIQIAALATGRALRRIPPADVERMRAAARAKGIEEGDQHFRALRRLLWNTLRPGRVTGAA